MRALIAGNWKMNGLVQDLSELSALEAGLRANPPAADVLLCLPATLLVRAASLAQACALGGQDCSAQDRGAFTGDISAAMLKDAGATHVLCGHSERRQHHGESDALVAAKAQAAWRAGLIAIICVGERRAAHDAGRGQAHAVCRDQLLNSLPAGATAQNTVIGYEPAWAIGSGITPTADEIADMHAYLRDCLVERLGEAGRVINILYGGSVTPANAGQILSIRHVGGALVGGASLKASDFSRIIAAVKPL